MSIFCLLWVPLFYLFRRSFTMDGGSGVWALILGSITAIVQFFLGYFVNPGGFGHSRVIFGFIDIVSVPVLIPVFVYFIILLFKRFSAQIDFANFALLWLIPVGALKALSWSSTNDPILLVMTPLLWTALASGISYFISLMINNFKWYKAVFFIPFLLILPAAAAVTYWAFFSQQEEIGFALLVLTNIPLLLSVISGIRHGR